MCIVLLCIAEVDCCSGRVGLVRTIFWQNFFLIINYCVVTVTTSSQRRIPILDGPVRPNTQHPWPSWVRTWCCPWWGLCRMDGHNSHPRPRAINGVQSRQLHQAQCTSRVGLVSSQCTSNSPHAIVSPRMETRRSRLRRRRTTTTT